MSDDFQGNARYRVVRRLGAGGMGIVYEAIDTERGSQRVALKVLRGRDADALVRLKREFRSLADVQHENLVALHDLVAEGDTWFFTLELVEGVDFLEWVRPGMGAPPKDLPTAPIDQTVKSPAGGRGTLDRARLDAALRQLTQGVAALHAAGRLHRDLKPSNVLVTPTGRVVILDFGLATELDGERSISEQQGHAIVGTAAYMAPEQAESGPVSPESDWYAVGCMLYQALTGRVPFEGSAVQVLLDKQRMAAPPPSERAKDVAPELEALCVALLKRVPSERAGAARILEALGQAPAAAKPTVRGDQGFIGRQAELAALQAALTATRGGSPRVVRITGGSGIGKTALVREFLARAEEAGAVALAGRCYERESVPYKALDSAIDALARHLGALPPDKADALLPRDAWALSRMFPVLKRVDAFVKAPVREVKEAHELRRRATAALREVFGRMADRAPLIVFIDDLQWTDEDSAALLEQLLAPPDAPAMLLVVTTRDDETPAPGPFETIALGALSLEDSLALAHRVLPADAAARADQVSRESGGNPFLLQQLAAFGAEASLDGVVLARAAQLAEPARRLLEAICLSGRPLDAKVAGAAVGQGDDDAQVRLLKGARLVRATPAGERERLEAWHDRIRETVVQSLSADEQTKLHRQLADAIAAHAPDELDALAHHLIGARETARAADATARAAKVTAEQLAFDRAAALYRQALDLLPADSPMRHPLVVALGHCLADAGRGPEAADAYAIAVKDGAATAGEALDLKRRAAEQLLRSGHVDEGMQRLRDVLAVVGMTIAPQPWRAFVALLFRRAHLHLRGLEFNEKPAADVDPAELRRIDVCWSVSVGLAMIDTMRGASFQTRQLILALRAGEPYRVARALAAEASFVATIGERGEARAAALIQEAHALAVRVGDPQLMGLIEFCTGLTHFLVGRWKAAQSNQVEAEKLFREAGSAVTWEAASARLFAVWSLFYLGELKQLSTRLPALLDEAKRRGDRYTITSLQSGLATVARLAAGQPGPARASVREVLSTWSTGSFQFQHYWSLLSEGMIDLYEGDGESAWQRLEEHWRALKGSLFLRIQNVRVEARFLRARSAVATGRLGDALGDAERMEGEGVPWARAFSMLIRAAVASARKMPDRAEALLQRAIGLLEQHDMALFAAAARARLGALEGGDVGAARLKAGHAWMLAQGVVDPDAMTRMLVPWFA